MYTNNETKRKSWRDTHGVLWEECTGKEWDKLMESEREFINFGEGYVYARRQERGDYGQ